MDAIEKEWRPQPRQERFLESPAREILFGGARGGGKTDAGIIWVALPAMREKHSRFRGLVLRDTANSLADWIDRADSIYRRTGARLVKSPWLHFVWPWGAKIFMGHLRDSRSISNYLGREFQRVLIEELTTIGDFKLYLKLLGSLRSTVKGLVPRIAATTNPGGAGHYWVKKRFVDPAPPNTLFREKGSPLTRIFIPSLVTDNKILCDIDPAYVSYLDSLPDKLKKAWRFGDWSILEGSYFTEFSRATHTCRPFKIPRSWARYRAIDWGYWPDPCVCTWIAVSPVQSRIQEVVYRERHWFRTSPGDVAKDILLLSNLEDVSFTVADPSMWASKSGPSDAEKMLNAGLVLRPADNSRVTGWTRLHEALKINRHKINQKAFSIPEMTIFNTCTKSIEAFEIAQHDERNPMDVASNKLDHWLDTLRYYRMSRPVKGKIDITDNPLSLKAIRYRNNKVDLRGF